MIDDHLVRLLGGSRRLTSIDYAAVRKYQADRQAEGAANGTINREISLLTRAFRLAVKARDVYTVPEFDRLAEADPRSGYVTRAQFDKIARRLPPWLRAPLTVLFVLGWRRNEVIRMTPAQVDMNRNTITLPAARSKSKKERTVAMTPEVRAIVAKQLQSVRRLKREGVNTKWLFHQRRGAAIGSFKKRWKTATAKAGHEGLLVHDLRRSAARNLIDAGVDKQLAMQFLGHATPSIFDRYRITDENNMQAAAETYGAWLSKKPKRQRGVVRPFTPKRHAS